MQYQLQTQEPSRTEDVFTRTIFTFECFNWQMPRPTLVVELSHSAPEACSSPATARRETPAKATRKSVGKSAKPKLPQIFATARVSAHIFLEVNNISMLSVPKRNTSRAKSKTKSKKQKQMTLQPVWRSAVFRITDGLRERERAGVSVKARVHCCYVNRKLLRQLSLQLC